MRLSAAEMEERRSTILQNAFHMFCQRGIEAVSLLEITEASQVSENTVYRYFGNKETLVLEAFVKLWDTIMRGVEQEVEGLPDYAQRSGFEQLRAWMLGFRRLFCVDQDFVLFSYEAKLYLLRHDVKLDRTHQDVLMQAIREPCLAALDKGKRDGSIPTTQDSTDLFYAIWGAIRGYVVKIVVYERLYEEDSPWQSRYETMMEGILSALSAGWRIQDAPTPLPTGLQRPAAQ